MAYPRLHLAAAPTWTAEDLRLWAAAFRGLCIAGAWWIAAHLFVLLFALYSPAGGFLFLVATLIFGAIFGYVLSNHAKAFGYSRFGALIAGVIVGCLPIGNLLFLGLYGNRLQENFKKAHVRLGLMGPDPTSLALAISQSEQRGRENVRT